ncbi:MAG: hypothetical protein NVSMB63_09380 [Sediminibacterium sp.]
MLLSTCCVTAQVKADTIPPYKKNPKIPAFRILQADSTWFSNKEIPKSHFTIMIYFSPDCGHCQYEAKEIVRNMDSLKKVFFVWSSYHPVNEIKDFYHKYGLDKFSNIRIGRDPNYAIPSFYQVKFTPFVAVYNKKGLFIKAYETGVEMAQLNALLRENY